jgi:hypothetical protein
MIDTVPLLRLVLRDVDCLHLAAVAGNVRMVQGRDHFRFALKACEPVVVGRQRRRGS